MNITDLIACRLSGQIPDAAWQEHLDASPKLRAAWEARQPVVESATDTLKALAKRKIAADAQPGSAWREAELDYRLAAHPQAVLALIAQKEAAEAEAARLREAAAYARAELVFVRDGSIGGIPNSMVASIPEAIEKIDAALATPEGK